MSENKDNYGGARANSGHKPKNNIFYRRKVPKDIIDSLDFKLQILKEPLDRKIGDALFYSDYKTVNGERSLYLIKAKIVDIKDNYYILDKIHRSRDYNNKQISEIIKVHISRSLSYRSSQGLIEFYTDFEEAWFNHIRLCEDNILRKILDSNSESTYKEFISTCLYLGFREALLDYAKKFKMLNVYSERFCR